MNQHKSYGEMPKQKSAKHKKKREEITTKKSVHTHQYHNNNNGNNNNGQKSHVELLKKTVNKTEIFVSRQSEESEIDW